jgi:hypothetical protein
MKRKKINKRALGEIFYFDEGLIRDNFDKIRRIDFLIREHSQKVLYKNPYEKAENKLREIVSIYPSAFKLSNTDIEIEEIYKTFEVSKILEIIGDIFKDKLIKMVYEVLEDIDRILYKKEKDGLKNFDSEYIESLRDKFRIKIVFEIETFKIKEFGLSYIRSEDLSKKIINLITDHNFSNFTNGGEYNLQDLYKSIKESTLSLERDIDSLDYESILSDKFIREVKGLENFISEKENLIYDDYRYGSIIEILTEILNNYNFYNDLDKNLLDNISKSNKLIEGLRGLFDRYPKFYSLMVERFASLYNEKREFEDILKELEYLRDNFSKNDLIKFVKKIKKSYGLYNGYSKKLVNFIMFLENIKQVRDNISEEVLINYLYSREKYSSYTINYKNIYDRLVYIFTYLIPKNLSLKMTGSLKKVASKIVNMNRIDIAQIIMDKNSTSGYLNLLNLSGALLENKVDLYLLLSELTKNIQRFKNINYYYNRDNEFTHKVKNIKELMSKINILLDFAKGGHELGLSIESVVSMFNEYGNKKLSEAKIRSILSVEKTKQNESLSSSSLLGIENNIFNKINNINLINEEGKFYIKMVFEYLKGKKIPDKYLMLGSRNISIVNSAIEILENGDEAIKEYGLEIENLDDIPKEYKQYNLSLEEGKVAQFQDLNLNLKEYNFRIIPAGSLRYFTIGAETDCCQHLGGQGEDAVIDSYINPLAGVLILENNKGLIAQSYIHYVPQISSFILDNVELVESLKNVEKEDAIKQYVKLAKHLKKLGYKGAWIGVNYTDYIFKNFFIQEQGPKDIRYIASEEKYSDYANGKNAYNLFKPLNSDYIPPSMKFDYKPFAQLNQAASKFNLLVQAFLNSNI